MVDTDSDDIVIALEQTIMTLPARQIAVLCLFADGYKQHDIVAILGISRTTVWADMNEATEKLKVMLTSEVV